MKITKSEFVISAVKPAQYPEDALPEIALAGRSNVGKSSLINCLIQRKNLARTSSKPGKTQTINFYRLNDQFYFADVPGYGFARVSKSMRQAWGRMIERYMTSRENLRAVIQVVDIRHPPSKDDEQMFAFLQYHQLPIIVVATKADKISRNQQHKHLRIIRERLDLSPNVPLVLFSAVSRLGKDELWDKLSDYL